MLGWFRRHAKVLMVVLGSSAMAIFGLGPVFDRLAQPGGLTGGNEVEVVATWKGGEITRDFLDQLRTRHYQSRRFLSGVQEAAFKQKGDQYRSLAAPISPIQDGRDEQVDDQLITRFLMAERAKSEGIVASDGMVDDYIAMISGDAGFSKRDLEDINRVQNNNYCSLRAVKEHLKIELLHNQMSNFSLMGIPMFPSTTEAIELHQRTKNQIECEVLAVDVDEYVNKISEEPPAAELRKLFEEGKYEFSDPRGERPGFKIRRMMNVQYLEADYDTYLQNEMNKLTDEEIQKEYDRLVEEKSPLVTEIVEADNSIEINSPPPMKTEEGDGESAPGDVDAPPSDVEAPPGETETTEEPKKDTASESGENSEKATEKATEGQSEEPKGEESSSEKDAGTKSSEAESAESKEGKAEGEKSEEGKQSFNLTNKDFQFVSTTNQEAGEQEKTEEAGEAEPAKQEEEAPSKGESPEAPTQGDAEQGDAEKMEETQSADANEVGGITDIENALKNQEEAAPEPERRVKPLKDVLEDVKKSMVEAAVNKAMETAVTKASVMVQDHFEKQMRYEFEKERGRGEEPPALDIQKIASDYNLVPAETGMVDYQKLSESTIGGVRILMNAVIQGRQIPRLVPVSDLVFDDFSELRTFDSQTVNDNWGSKSNYLFWVSEKSEARIPDYDEVSDDVENFWRQKKAYEMAMAEAKKIEAKVNGESGKKMSDLYFERVFQTGAFSWFNNFGNVGLSRPAGVTNAGDEFMSAAFSLGEMEAGVAPNQSRDKIYVIQSSTGSQPTSELGMDYLENQLFKYKVVPQDIRQVSQYYGRELNMDWSEEFVEDMDLKYVNR